MIDLDFYPYEQFEPSMNMALDEYFLKHTTGISVRLYGWSPGGVSLGKSQTIEQAVDVAFCRQHGIPVVRRSTGGAAVYHKGDVTYMVAAPLRAFTDSSVLGCYRDIARILLATFHDLGLSCRFAGKVNMVDRRNGLKSGIACFLLPSDYEIVSDGRKLVGNAQRRESGRLMQHGSIAWDFDYIETASLLRASEDNLRDKVTAVKDHLPDRTPADLQTAMVTTLKRNGFHVNLGGPVLDHVDRDKVFELLDAFPLQ